MSPSKYNQHHNNEKLKWRNIFLHILNVEFTAGWLTLLLLVRIAI
jgi:hypothetical protein